MEFQICDRCKIPTSQAVIECKECSLMIYSQTGLDLQPMRCCAQCDELIHDISYKRAHRRTQFALPHKTIQLSDFKMQRPLSMNELTPHDVSQQRETPKLGN